jgi:hypothetical protein
LWVRQGAYPIVEYLKVNDSGRFQPFPQILD